MKDNKLMTIMIDVPREATKKKQEKKFTTVVNYGGGSANFGV